MPKNAKHPNQKSNENWKPHPDDKNAIFVSRALDDYGLNLYEFRILAHVSRREGPKHGCYASQKKMAESCGMGQRKVLEVLKVLCEAGILRKEKSPTRRTNIYRLNPGSKWKHPRELENIRQKAKSPKNSKSQQESEQVNEYENLESENTSENNIFAEKELFPDLWE
ncbi:MAG: helix-turn-helix domain-containing protein [Okeania sp. SIO3B5]|uniref:helix-turn-helix domain-containing protein n=1 Tax=Okeania sp. SIO3B5 TaxID=2607811 RepID=UPI001400A151|nr:helix-turn-helix domain-containing protein [Okeania sp. SIO3B5]NEO53806.1 helix-turn-helix domain-containing protein [Okeania sp. SIO3B5]